VSNPTTVRRSLGHVPVRLLALSGLVIALAGGLRWAFDAGASTGQWLILYGVLVLVVAAVLRTVRSTPWSWVILGLGVVLLVFGIGEIWDALSVINENRSAHLA
jgi:hypothetical protein